VKVTKIILYRHRKAGSIYTFWKIWEILRLWRFVDSLVLLMTEQDLSCFRRGIAVDCSLSSFLGAVAGCRSD
jgi:hypothetical protein